MIGQRDSTSRFGSRSYSTWVKRSAIDTHLTLAQRREHTPHTRHHALILMEYLIYDWNTHTPEAFRFRPGPCSVMAHASRAGKIGLWTVSDEEECRGDRKVRSQTAFRNWHCAERARDLKVPFRTKGSFSPPLYDRIKLTHKYKICLDYKLWPTLHHFNK